MPEWMALGITVEEAVRRIGTEGAVCRVESVGGGLEPGTVEAFVHCSDPNVGNVWLNVSVPSLWSVPPAA